MDEYEQFQRLAVNIARRKQQKGDSIRSWTADDRATVTGWLIEQAESRRDMRYNSSHDWCDDWLDIEYLLGIDGKIYCYQYWMYEDNRTQKATGKTLKEIGPSELVGNRGAPFSDWTQKIKRLQWK